MSTIYGSDLAQQRIRNETMKPSTGVDIAHDYYSNNQKAKHAKMKEMECSNKTSGDELGYFGRENKNKYAMGGPIKERRGFFNKTK
jgi:hypothetical protein